jgi:hypothetical protein
MRRQPQNVSYIVAEPCIDLKDRSYIESVWERSLTSRPPIQGHRKPERPDGGMEDGPGWQTGAEAITWGRKRAPIVCGDTRRDTHPDRFPQNLVKIGAQTVPLRYRCSAS